MKRILIFIALCVSLAGNAQIRQSLSTNKSTKLNLGTPTTQSSSTDGKQKETEEFVLYRNLVRQYTWLVGQGEPITQEVANHLPYYFKLSMKNEKGHWQHIEAMHGNALTTEHNQNTYFIDIQNDTTNVSTEWITKPKTVAQWFITSDLSGDCVAEERGYTAEGDMIYGFIPIQNDSIHVTGSYIDAWGYPVDMMQSSVYTYGSVVYITYDKYGCDYILDFLDGAGYRKPNTNGVDQSRTVYDEKLRPVLSTSHNCVGDYCIDNWGNCGVKYVYAADGKSYTITFVDENLNPMRMPPERASVDETFISCKYVFDEWGREKEAIYLNADGENDATLSGINKIVTEYTADGKIKSKSYFDITGNLMKTE